MKKFLEIVSISAILLLAFNFVSCKNSSDGDGDNRDTVTPTLSWEEIKELDTNPLESILQLAPDYHEKSTKVVVPEGFTSIRKGIFTESDYLEEIEIPASVLYIDDEAFKGSSNYNNYGGNPATYYHSSLKSVVFAKKSNLKKIGSSAFKYCHLLTSISFPNGLQEIGDYAFGSSGIKNIVIPKTVVKIGKGAFCSEKTALSHDLESVEFAKGIKLQEIENETFKYQRFKTIDLPKELKKIGESAFLHCNLLESINIPNTVEEIGGSAFKECTSLESVTLTGVVPTIGINVFYECIKLESIYVPSASVDEYKTKLPIYADKIKAISE